MHKTQRKCSKGAGLAALCWMICISSSLAHAGGGTDPDRPKKHAIGPCVGVPQTFALTYERRLGSQLAARIHLGSAVLLSSAGARVQWGHNGTGFHPYFFTGAALIHSVAEGYGDPKGVAGYIWLGPGMNLRQDRWTLYAEVSALLGGDEDRGLGDDWIFPFSPAVTLGLMLHF
jgi:hypothetical protein